MSSVSSTAASSLLTQIQQQLLSTYVSGHSGKSTDATSASSVGGDWWEGGAMGCGGNASSPASAADDSTFTSVSLVGSGSLFGPGMFAQLLSYLQDPSAAAASATAATASNATDGSTTGTSNSTDSNSAANPLTQALFDAIDTDDSPTISKQQLETAFTANGGTANSADALYAQLTGSANSTDGITVGELASSLAQSPSGAAGSPGGLGALPPGTQGFFFEAEKFSSPGGGGGFFEAAGILTSSASSAAAPAGDAGSSQTVTNPDGSTTTTTTYADGTTVAITKPAAASDSTAASATATAATGATSNSDDASTASGGASQLIANFQQFMTQMLALEGQLLNSQGAGNQLSVLA